MPGEINIFTCGCNPMPGTQPPDIAPYVVSIGGLYGIVDLNGTGIIEISTTGNTINFGIAPGAGLGTVTQVSASSSNSNLVVTGGPISTFGTFSFSLSGALNSISGLVTAADQMIYTTASNTYAVTPLTALARNLLSDATAANMRITLGSVIGTNVQAWSADLDSFVSNATWAGSALTLTGSQLTIEDLLVNGASTFSSAVVMNSTLTVNAALTATSFSGDGSALTNLSAASIATGTLAVARGGTNISVYNIGDLLQATGTGTLARLASVSANSYLRSVGVNTPSVWSTLKLPNSATAGDLFYGSASNIMGNLPDVASGNVLLSGGVGVAPAYGKVTSTHTDGTTIATIAAGANTNITSFVSSIQFTDSVAVVGHFVAVGEFWDSTQSPAAGDGYIFTSVGGLGIWSNQINLDTLNIVTSLSAEATVTAGGTTGAQVINKLSGSVNFAAGASSLIVTNSLCTADTFIFCTVLTNDTTAIIKNVVATSGSFTIRLNAAATGETKVAFLLVEPS